MNDKCKDLISKLGNPGMMLYVKEKYYDEGIKYLEDKMNSFNDLQRFGGVLKKEKFKDFQYKEEIPCCDYSNEPFEDEDVLVLIWQVDKKYLKNESTK
jgi:hypothetical protein